MSFATEEEIFSLVEGLLAQIFHAVSDTRVSLRFPRLTYHEAMNRYGTDKPDRRFAIELVELNDVFRESQFKVFQTAIADRGVVKGINVSRDSPILPQVKSSISRKSPANLAREVWPLLRSRMPSGSLRS